MRRLAVVLLGLVWIAATIGPVDAAGHGSVGPSGDQSLARPASPVQAATTHASFRLDSITCCFISANFLDPSQGFSPFNCLTNTGVNLSVTPRGTIDLNGPGPAVRLALQGTIIGFLTSPDPASTLSNSPAGSYGVMVQLADPLHAGQTIYTVYSDMGQFNTATNTLGQSFVNQSLVDNQTYPPGTVLGNQGDIFATPSSMFTPIWAGEGTQVHVAILKLPVESCDNALDPSPYVGTNVNFDGAANQPGTPLHLLPPPPAPQVPARPPAPRVPAPQVTSSSSAHAPARSAAPRAAAPQIG